MQTGPPSAKLSAPLFSASRLGQRRSHLSSGYRRERAPELWIPLWSHCPGREVAAERHIRTNEHAILCAAEIYAQFAHVHDARSRFGSILLRVILSPSARPSILLTASPRRQKFPDKRLIVGWSHCANTCARAISAGGPSSSTPLVAAIF